MNRASKFAIVGLADMLQHADGDEHIVVPGDAPVVVFDELDAPRQPFVAGAPAGPGDLIRRDVIGANAGAVVARHIQREGTPSTPHLDYALSGPQVQFAA